MKLLPAPDPTTTPAPNTYQPCDGHNSGNFDVMFENGHVGNCHPAWRMRYYSGDTLLREFGE